MPKVRVNGIETYYEVHGKGLPVLFIHGGFGGIMSTLMPRQDIPPLLPTDRVQTIRYDRRNAFRSEYTLRPYGLADLADDARALLNYLGIERSVIIGDSMGGPIALTYALTYPGRTIGLGLIETGASLMAMGQEGIGGPGRSMYAVQRARELGDRTFFETRKAQIRALPPPPSPGLVSDAQAQYWLSQRDKLAEELLKASDETLFTLTTGQTRNMEAYHGIDLSPRLGELKMPVCIIHGDADPNVVTSFAHKLKVGIPHAELHLIPGGTHGILTFPAAANALREWVLGIDEARLGGTT